MKTAIRYYTRSGNTEKLAMSIADALQITAERIDVPLDEPVDLLFLGCSYYAFDVDPAVKQFITDNRGKIGKIVCFGTSAMMKSIYRPMKKVADAAGIPLEKEDFHCRGEFGPFHGGRPNEDDRRQAAAFALKAVSR